MEDQLKLFQAIRQAARDYHAAGNSFRLTPYNGWPALKFIDHIIYSPEGLGLRYTNLKSPSVDFEIVPPDYMQFRNAAGIFHFLILRRYKWLDGNKKKKRVDKIDIDTE